MISKLSAIIPTKGSQPQSQSDEPSNLLTIKEIASYTDKQFWDSVGLMSFTEIRRLVPESSSDDEIEKVLKSRFNDVNFWHHMSEKTVRNILDRIKINHPDLLDTVFSIDSILESAAEDRVIVDQLRKEHGLTGNYKLDNSILLKVSEEYR